MRLLLYLLLLFGFIIACLFTEGWILLGVVLLKVLIVLITDREVFRIVGRIKLWITFILIALLVATFLSYRLIPEDSPYDREVVELQREYSLADMRDHLPTHLSLKIDGVQRGFALNKDDYLIVNKHEDWKDRDFQTTPDLIEYYEAKKKDTIDYPRLARATYGEEKNITLSIMYYPSSSYCSSFMKKIFNLEKENIPSSLLKAAEKRIDDKGNMEYEGWIKYDWMYYVEKQDNTNNQAANNQELYRAGYFWKNKRFVCSIEVKNIPGTIEHPDPYFGTIEDLGTTQAEMYVMEIVKDHEYIGKYINLRSLIPGVHDHSIFILGYSYTWSKILLAMYMLLRAFLIILSMNYFNRRIAIEELKTGLLKIKAKDMAYSLPISLNILPIIQNTLVNTLVSFRLKGGFRRRLLSNLKMLIYTVLLNTVKMAEELSQIMEVNADYLFRWEKTAQEREKLHADYKNEI